MQYGLAFKYFVDRPGGWSNLLLVTLCLLIPAIGPIVILGYQAEVAERLIRDPDIRRHPRFTFDRFVEYLTRGIWPFVVQLLVSLVAMVLLLPAIGVFIALAMANVPIIGAVVVALFAVVVMMGAVILSWPWMLHAELTGGLDLRSGWAFVKEFWQLLGVRVYVSIVVFWLMGSAVAVAGLLLCFVGIYPASTLAQMAAQHLVVQHYLMYLDAGGTPIDQHLPEDAEEYLDDRDE